MALEFTGVNQSMKWSNTYIQRLEHNFRMTSTSNRRIVQFGVQRNLQECVLRWRQHRLDANVSYRTKCIDVVLLSGEPFT